MRCLVTGAAGFIGSHVVRSLLARGHEVRALHLPTDDTRNLRGLAVEAVPGDVTDRASMRAAVAGCDWVFHLAAVYALWARDPSRLSFVNVEGTRRTLAAARDAGVSRVVMTSSIARFGGQGKGVRATEESPFRLGSTGDLYSRTKYEAHEVARGFFRDGMDVVLVAPTAPIGPGDVGPTPTGRILLACATAPVVVVTDTATNVVDVRDVAEGHVLAAERARAGESYLLGNVDLTAAELATRALAALGKRKRVLVAPLPLAEAVARALLFSADHVTHRAPLMTPAAVRIARLGLRADTSKAVRELGMPQSSIDAALGDALRWFAEEGPRA